MYNAAQHAIHVQQHEDWIRLLYNLNEEAIRLRQVRQFSINNGVAGALSNPDADYVDTAKYTVAEIEAASTIMNQFIAFIATGTGVGAAKAAGMTPFLQEEV